MSALILFLLAVLAGLISFIEKKKNKNEDRARSPLNLYAFILLLFSASVSYWSSCNADKKNKMAAKLENSFKQKSDSMHLVIDSLVKLNNGKTDSLNRLLNEDLEASLNTIVITKKLADVQDKAGSLQKELYNQVTGENSIPLLEAHLLYQRDIAENNPFIPIIKMTLKNFGKYPITNITIKHFKYKRYLDPSIIEEFHINYLGTELPYDFKTFALGEESTSSVYNLTYGFTVTWKNYEYIYEFTINKNNIENGATQYKIKEKYFYSGEIFNTIEELKNRIVKNFKQ